MMSNLTEHLTFTVPLTAENCWQAETFSRLHKNPDKARQVYLNTLAVQAVNFYCRCLGIETDLPASHSAQPAMQAFLDTADLLVKGWGRLECRPVLRGAKVCPLPEDVREDRVGYVVVEIDEDAKQAKLLGFAKTAPTGVLILSELRSLEDLIDEIPEPIDEPAPPVVNLLQWLEGVFDAGWQAVEELVSPKLMPAFKSQVAKRAKLIRDLGIDVQGHPVVLTINVWEEEAGAVGVKARVYPSGEDTTLPPNLKLTVLTDTGEVFKEVTARCDDEFIQYEFEAERGDKFGVRVSLGDAGVTEQFSI
jgi:hypothetical protein